MLLYFQNKFVVLMMVYCDDDYNYDILVMMIY